MAAVDWLLVARLMASPRKRVCPGFQIQHLGPEREADSERAALTCVALNADAAAVARMLTAE